MARTELGQLRVQGTDFTYTLQGWLKGVNQSSLDPTKDIGGDGTGTSIVARDVLSYGLHYYDETIGSTNYRDYKAIGGGLPFARPGAASDMLSLYNGNIAAMSVNNAGLLKANASTNNTMPLFYRYRYDQLNRIVAMQAYKGLDAATNTWTAVGMNDYKEAISYDPNGNIETYNRKGAPTAGLPLEMDDMAYGYYAGTNKLRHVGDNVAATNYTAANGTEDIDNQTNPDNYTYDKIGNLTGDDGEHLSNVTWSVYGKILSIQKPAGLITYEYDASGNRVSKTAAGKTTVYARDASGNVMSVYESQSNAQPVQKELHLYGSSRIGMATELTLLPFEPTGTDVLQPGFGTGLTSTFTRGEKLYELSNHLGNVLETISDRKNQHTADNTEVDYYLADVMSAGDYAPFGMGLARRKYESSGSRYRYSLNGQEKSDELNESLSSAKFWEYDGRIGRRWNIDPKQKIGESPYLCFSGNPIWLSDRNGDEAEQQGKKKKKANQEKEKAKQPQQPVPATPLPATATTTATILNYSYSKLDDGWKESKEGGQSLLEKEKCLNQYVGTDPLTNTCAIRFSYASNEAGYPIPTSSPGVRITLGQEGDNGNYIVGLKMLGNILKIRGLPL